MTSAAKTDTRQFIAGKNIFTITECTIDGKNDFQIIRTHREPLHLDAPPLNQPTAWKVHLPHQCDEWEIASGTDPSAALAELDAFIAEAQQARVKLSELVAGFQK